MDEKTERQEIKKSEGTFHNIVLYSFIGIMGLAFVAILGFLVYAIFA